MVNLSQPRVRDATAHCAGTSRNSGLFEEVFLEKSTNMASITAHLRIY